MKSKLLNSSITIVCTLFLLSGCGKEKTTNSEANFTKESQTPKKILNYHYLKYYLNIRYGITLKLTK